MKHILKQLVDQEEDDSRRRNITREYLQGRILHSLQEGGTFSTWAFLGGTALRFLYALPRYSEDLDFSLVDSALAPDFEKQIDRIRKDLEKETYRVETIIKKSSAVFNGMIRFRGLFFELGISPHPEEVLSIKIEIDTKPPAGARTETTILRRFFLLNIMHYDKSSFLAGKLNALLTRAYAKGRDLFDLAWYLSDPQWPPPNITLLNNSLEQFGWAGPEVTGENWPILIKEKISTVDWKKAAADAGPFLERTGDSSFIDGEIILRLLNNRLRDS